MHDDVMTQLKRHLASAEQIDVSRYQFVNIEPVKDAAGSRWPSLRERVFIASKSIIERKLADDDLIIQCATGYLVIFKALSGGPAQKLTDVIKGDLEQFFLGDKALERLGVQAQSEQLSVEEFTATLAAADVEETRSRPPQPNEKSQPQQTTSLIYQPVWDKDREAVASYFVRPALRMQGANTAVHQTQIEHRQLTPDARLALDQDILDSAADALEALVQNGSRCALIVPAGFTSLSNGRTRSQYVTAIAALPKALRQLIWIQIKDASFDAPELRLEETARILLAQSGKLFIHTKLRWPNWNRFENIGASAIGADFPRHYSPADRQDVGRFLASAKRAKAQVYFDHVDDWQSLRSATRSGAHLFAGKAFGIETAPQAPYRISRSALLAQTG